MKAGLGSWKKTIQSYAYSGIQEGLNQVSGIRKDTL